MNTANTIMAATALTAAGMSQGYNAYDQPVLDTMNSIALSNNDGGFDFSLLRPRPLRPDQVAWPKNQRKSRKNRRRANAAGVKNAFK